MNLLEMRRLVQLSARRRADLRRRGDARLAKNDRRTKAREDPVSLHLPMRFRVGAATDTGRVRKLNEDAFAVVPEHGLFVVCDGMGGARAGEVASRMAVETITATLADTGAASPSGAARREGYRPFTSRLAQAVERSNQAILDHAEQDEGHAGMGTTVVAALIAEEIASIAHVGDSRAYLWRNGAVEPLTKDHSVVQEQVEEGLLSQEQSLQSKHQNLLLRALGHKPDVEVDLAEVPLRSGDYLVLCSDGMTRMVSERELAATITAIQDPQGVCDALLASANRGGSPDNVTVVIVEVRESWWGRLWPRT